MELETKELEIARDTWELTAGDAVTGLEAEHFGVEKNSIATVGTEIVDLQLTESMPDILSHGGRFGRVPLTVDQYLVAHDSFVESILLDCCFGYHIS